MDHFPLFSLSLFGISPVVQTDCSHTWMFRVNPDLQWHHFVNPIMLLVLYYTLATLIRLWLQESEDVVRLQSEFFCSILFHLFIGLRK